MNVIGPYAIGFAIGIFGAPFFSVWVMWRMSRRLARHQELERIADDLEKRRAARDSGRESEIREDAGPAGSQSNLFAIHPGKLELNRRKEKREMLANDLAPWQNSGTLNESGSEQSGNEG